MKIDPTAFVNLAGARIAGGVAGTAPVALADLKVQWGRDDLYAQAEPGTARVALFDPTGTWAARTDVRGYPDVMGDLLEVGWTASGTDRVLFRGRVTGAAVRPYTADGMRGAILVLDGVSLLEDLANRTNGTEALPHESVTARATRYNGSAYLGGTNSIATLDFTGSVTIARSMRYRPRHDVNLLEGVAAIFDQANQKMSYLPNTQLLRGVSRRNYPARRGIAGLVRAATGDRVGKGAYIATHAITVGAETTTPLYLDTGDTGDGVEAPSGAWLTRTAAQRITRVTVKAWTTNGASISPGANTYAEDVTQVSLTASRIRAGDRDSTITVETASSATGIGSTLATDLADMVTREGAEWTPKPLTVELRRRGFDSLDLALFFLAGGELPSPVFLQNSRFPELGIRPVYGVMGGTITHDEEGWQLELNLAPVSTNLAQHPISWAEVDDGTPGNIVRLYADGGEHTDGLHESVTFEDLAYCSTGLGVTTPGPDTGWDILQ